jgi:hypothetical protein
LANTLIITSYPPSWQQLADMTCKTHADYAKKHGYDYAADCSDLQDTVWRQGHRIGIRGFIKWDLMLHYWERYEYICWLDADLLVTNHDIPLETIRSHGLSVCRDFNGLNTTVMLAHTTPQLREMIWAVNNTGRKFFLAHDWHEMESLRYFQMTEPYNKMLTYHSVKDVCPILGPEYPLPEWLWKAYNWERGDWMLHLSALHPQRRIERAREYGEMLGLL